MSRLARATQIAIDDPGIEKLRYLCWIVMGVKVLPKTWSVGGTGLSNSRCTEDYEYVTPYQLVESYCE